MIQPGAPRPPMVAALDQPRLAFVGAPKVMTTSLGLVFYELAYGRPYRPEENGGRYIHQFWQAEGRARGWHRPRPFEALAGWRMFTVVRDPAQRLISAWANRVIDKAEAAAVFAELRATGQGAACEGLPDLPDCDTFLAELPRYRALVPSVAHHTDPLALYLGETLAPYARVFRMDEAEALAAWLSDQTGRPVRLPHAQRSFPKVGLADLGARALAQVAAHCAADYRLLEGLVVPEPVVEAALAAATPFSSGAPAPAT
jgi:hypothetical protein